MVVRHNRYGRLQPSSPPAWGLARACAAFTEFESLQSFEPLRRESLRWICAPAPPALRAPGSGLSELKTGRTSAQRVLTSLVSTHIKTLVSTAVFLGNFAHHMQSYRVKPHGQLVLVSSNACTSSTPSLSTSWSTTTLQGGRAPRQISSWDEFPA